MPNQSAIESEATTVELLRTAFTEARELASAEIALAKQELAEDGKGALIAIVSAGAAAALGTIALTMLLIGALLAIGGTLTEAFVAGGLLFALAAAAAIFASTRFVPRKPLERTKTRLLGDVADLKGDIE